MSELQQFIEHKAYLLRYWSLIETSQAGSGHPTSCLSAADMVAVLFFYVMHYFPQEPRNLDNDRFILSKGHASALLYAVWKEVGLISESDLLTYRAAGSVLQGHPTPYFEPVLVATGSLGMGLAAGIGMAWNARMQKRTYKTYVLLGDAELAEGSVWEAVQLAVHYHLDNLIAIIDCNGLGQSTEPMYDHNISAYVNIFNAFGWQVHSVDGHDVGKIIHLFDTLQSAGKPIAIIVKTLKGYGLARVEGKQGYHGKAFNKQQLSELLNELKERFEKSASYDDGAYYWQPKKPTIHTVHHQAESMSEPSLDATKKMATRKAFGQALAAINNDKLVVLDGDVKNSTHTELFEEAHKSQFFESYVAEQAMVSIATGLYGCERIPFLATFGAFLTRAYDQIRMAAIGKAALRIAGSHAGVSIGEDGPSQMALEDIAFMQPLVNSVILYPADAVSTYHLVDAMMKYQQGISYLRLTREDTPILYKQDESFTIGGCKVLKESSQDSACIIAAGVTLFEALKAYEYLAKENIRVSIIDLYSIKPFDVKTVMRIVNASQKRLLVVEDHYVQGGIGQTVAYQLFPLIPDLTFVHLAVTKVPGSATAQEQRALAGIDADAIVKMLRRSLPGTN